MAEKKSTEATIISTEEQQKNQDKYEKQIDSMVFNAKKLISEEKFDEGIKILKDALEIVKNNPWGIMEFKISDLLDDVLSKHRTYLEKKRKEEEFESNKRKKMEEEQRAKQTLEKLKQKEMEEKQKKIELLKAKKQLEEKNSNLAYQLIEKGSKLHQNNDFQGAIEAYTEAKKLFSEINWVAEAAKMEDTLDTIREQQKQYLIKLEHEKKEKEKYEQELLKEKEMLKKVQEAESNREQTEVKKSKEDLESKLTKKELEKIAFDKLDLANNAISKYEYSKAIDFLEEAKDLFIKTGWTAEVDKVQSAIVKTKEQERQYLLKLEKDKQIQLKKQQEEQELLKKLENERLQKEKEEKEKQERLLQEKNKELREKQVSEHALRSIESIEKEIEVYKSKISLRDFSMDCPYGRAKQIYTDARRMFLEIGWTIQADKLLDIN
jgi:hypothetical protein